MEKKTKMKVKIDYSKLPNPFHQQQVMRGGRVHTNKAKLIPRKRKYKEKEDDLGV